MDDRPQVGRDQLVNRPGLIEAHNSPSLARDPRRPETVVVAHRIDRPGFSASLERSADNGRTWESTALPLPRGLDRPFAPDAAFAPDGTLYVTYVNLAGRGNVPANLWLSRSSDGGRTLSAPVRIAGRLAFQGRVAVDHAGVVHVTWLQAREVGLLALAGPPAPVVAARSDDGGRTFSRPVRVSDPARELVGAASTAGTVVDSLTLPAGNYIVLASVAIQHLGLPSDTRGGRCTLNRTGSSDSFTFDYRGAGHDQASHSAQLAVTTSATTTVTMRCTASVNDGARLLDSRMTAIRTDNLSLQ